LVLSRPSEQGLLGPHSEAEQSAKLLLELIGLLGHSALGHTDDAVACTLNPRVAPAIGLERAAVAVVCPAVQLDRDPLLAPQTVHEIARERDVDPGDG
jgi:hypothetical protein